MSQYSQEEQTHVRKKTIDIQVVMNGMARKETELNKGIQDIQIQANLMAKHITVGGELDGILSDDVLNQYRSALKDITVENISQQRDVQAYMTALKVLGDKTSSASASSKNNDDDDNMDVDQDDDNEDFQAMIETSMKTERTKIEQNSVDATEHQMYLDMLSKLGQTSQTVGGGTQGSGGGSGDGDDSDDDLMIVGEQETFKCPITGMFMVEPMRNTKCGHVYDKQGIQQHLRKKHACPVAGCTNNRVTMNQLVVDEELKLQIRRQKKRMEMEKRSRGTQRTYSVNDDDDDDE